MDSVINNAIRGMSQSSDMVARSSANLVNSFLPANVLRSSTARIAVPVDSPEYKGMINGSGMLTADAFLASAQVVDTSTPDPATEIVNMITAQAAFKASAKTFKIGDETEQALLDTLA
ncbi:MAG: hypothetical protein GC134_05805 [Proteobacteria bacterium]|nr:hypothetical protein [Pseudomonadota bacterium]